mgnify:CR=1 FL=1
MNQNKINFKQRLNSYLCPALLGATVCFTIVYSLYNQMVWFYSLIFLLLELLLFTLFDRLKTIRFFGGLLYTAMLVAVCFFSMRLLYLGWDTSEGDFLTWFYADEGSSDSHPMYFAAVFLGGGFFLISIMYYFTQVRYRSLGVMLCILFPFVIYAKRAEEIPEVLVTLIITLFIAVMVHNRRIDPAMPDHRRGKISVNKAYLISIALFVSVTGAVTMLIEKPQYRSQLEKNANYFDAVQTSGTGSGGGYENMSELSSPRYGGGYTTNPLFNFYTEGEMDVYFLRRQSYDYFNGSRWELADDNYAVAYSLQNPEIMTDDIIAAMEKLYESGNYDLNGAEPSEKLIPRTRARVQDDSFNPIYLPAPYGTITDEQNLTELIFMKFHTQEICRRGNYDENDGISESFEYFEQSSDLYRYAAQLGLTGKEYHEMLKQASADGDEIINKALEDYENAVAYLNNSNGYVSDNIVQLAYDITKDCKSDFEKAYALEQYFENNGFTYDLEYVPPDESIEYFLFESRTGSCTSYATSMTLMASALGLPAKYVEGFAAYERNSDGSFIVRDGHAHAYVEVYIPGAGWMTFDPTVSGYMQTSDDGNFNAGTFFAVLGRLLVVIAVVFVIVFVMLLDRIVELIFRLRMKFWDTEKRTLRLYANLIKVVNFSVQSDYSSYTVNMLRSYLNESRGICPDKLLELFEKTCFGGYKPTEEEFNEVYKEYKACYKYIRKIPKKKKAVSA